MSLMVFCFFQSYSDVCARLEPVIMVSRILPLLEDSYVKIYQSYFRNPETVESHHFGR